MHMTRKFGLELRAIVLHKNPYNVRKLSNCVVF